MADGRTFAFVFLLVVCFIIYFSITQAKNGKVPHVRSFPAIDALDPVIERAAKLNKPVHYITGVGGLHGDAAPMTIAGLSLLGKVASLCGKYSVPIRYTCSISYMIPIVEDLIKAGYTSAGNAEIYHPDMVVYVGEGQRGLMASVLGYNTREKPAATMIFGAIYWETIVYVGSGAVAGAVNIGGTPRLHYQAILATCCDYYLLGDELFAAAAAINEEPAQLGSVASQDRVKFFVMLLILLNILLTAIGSDWFARLITW
jgi:hypothetical protein